MKTADVGQFRMQIQHDWILIVYDIPRSKDYLRKRVIRVLRRLGALRHTVFPGGSIVGRKKK